MLMRAGLAPSTRQPVRLNQQGVISVGGAWIEQWEAGVATAEEYLLQRGEGRFAPCGSRRSKDPQADETLSS